MTGHYDGWPAYRKQCMNPDQSQKPDEKHAPAAGQRVRVRAGALAGIEGVVLCQRKDGRLVLTVPFSQNGVSIVIPKSLLDVL